MRTPEPESKPHEADSQGRGAGRGTMGSRIAAHIANAGVPVALLDMVPPERPPMRRRQPETSWRWPRWTG